MAETYEEVTSESWGGRMKGSFKSVIFGGAAVLVSIGILIWNESNLVAERKALDESESIVVDLPSPAKVDPKLENDLVYVTGFASTTDILKDDVFGISLSETLKLKRSVEMYQWVEKMDVKKTKKTGGSVEKKTTYSYSKDWKHYLVDSAVFTKPGYDNPTEMPFQDITEMASPINFGAFVLSEEVMDKINEFLPLAESPEISSIPEATMNTSGTISPFGNSGFFVGTGTLTSPMVGDVRVKFSQIPPQNITLVARQTGNTFRNYTTSNEREILLVKEGTYSLDAMFEGANKQLTTVTWVIRLVAFTIMWVALQLMAEPLVVFADVLPILGYCVEGIAYVISGLVAVCISLVTIALAWLFFRPVFSAILIAVVVVIGVGLAMIRRCCGRKAGYDEVKNAEDV